MAGLLFIELTSDGRVSIGAQPDGNLPISAAVELDELQWPLGSDALEELRWYLEDYLRAPFGVYESRGGTVQALLPSWGEAVFAAVFKTDAARGFYQQMRADLNGLRVVIRSQSAQMLALPWELIRDPARHLPLALDLAEIDRSIPSSEIETPFEVGGGRLRVLMVISRPAGASDVEFRMIARPLLERLVAVSGAVDLVVLRPPTLDMLAATLQEAAAAGEPFQLVHFDGHGRLVRRTSPGEALSVGQQDEPASEGMLVFQSPSGGSDLVSASRVAQVLSAGRVPVVVLNACQSGAIGKQLEAAVATRLLQNGAASVVAMAYSVYAVAAAEFMAAFYESLFRGDSVSAAVAAGRQRLFRNAERPSPAGSLPLADWLVPVHYLRQDVSFPTLARVRPTGGPSLDEALDQLHGLDPGSPDARLAPAEGVFIGRDGLFYELETAMQLNRIVILHGLAGVGKTELAKAFGRWWIDTGGVERAEWVFWHSFEPGLASFGLNGVISEIGLTVFGADFIRLDEGDQAREVERFLQDRRAMLIWDNFESVRSIPDPSATTAPLNDAECERLSSFLYRLAVSGGSTVLITSRSEETWLHDGSMPSGTVSESGPWNLRRIQVGGLPPQEAAEYAEELLAPYPVARNRRSERAFGELMQWLDGHPLSMRLTLPHLETTSPATLLAGLRGVVPLHGWEQSQQDRHSSLHASLRYSFEHLPPAARRLLIPLCLLYAVADADVLAIFSMAGNVPSQFSGFTKQDWTDVLDAAAEAGLLTTLGAGMYRLPPALPAFLVELWRDNAGVDYGAQRSAATQALLFAYGAFGDWLVQQITSGKSYIAYGLIDQQQNTMSYLLGYALDTKNWHKAQDIAQPLGFYWDTRGRYIEANAWTDRARIAIEDTAAAPPDLSSPAGSLWLYLTGGQANRLITSGHLDDAEGEYRKILALLEAQQVTAGLKERLAVTYYQLGTVAHQQRRLEEAADWGIRSLTIEEELGDQPAMARSYHLLGMIAHQRGRLEEAMAWYNRARVIAEEIHDLTYMTGTYHQLGVVAQDRGRPQEAADWYIRALDIAEEVGDQPAMAACYHQLGMVAQLRGRLEEAAGWFTRALLIREELGDQPGKALTYRALGMNSQFLGRLQEAEDWQTRALAIEEELGDRSAMARSYQQLGMVAQDQDRPRKAADWYNRALAIQQELGDQSAMALSYSLIGLLTEKEGDPASALEWMIRAVALFDPFPEPSAVAGPEYLARLTRQLGIPKLEVSWERITGTRLPSAVRAYVQASGSEGSGSA